MANPPNEINAGAPARPIKKIKAPSTQRYLPVSEIREDLVVLKDGTLRQILLVSSINFDLKTDDEQQAIILAYVQLLNSLHFSIQIMIQSRKLNISEYLGRLKAKEVEQTNELLRLQTMEYRQYVAELVDIADIMSKRFYVVIPFSPYKGGTRSFWQRVSDLFTPERVIHIQEQKLEQYREELARRVDLVQSGLQSMGLKTQLLDTQALIELFYESYNPKTSSNEALTAMTELRVEE